MGKYVPTAITYQNSGLVKDRDAFVLADDAYQQLNDMYLWRGRIRHRDPYGLLGRLRRVITAATFYDSGASVWSTNILTITGYIESIDISSAPTNTVNTGGSHGLSNGDVVYFTGVGGTTQLNGNSYTIANVTANTFEITQAAPSAFTNGGLWLSNRSLSTPEPNASIQCGSVTLVIDPGGTPETFTDNSNGTLTGSLGNTGTINYQTGALTITGAASGVTTTLSYSYFPTLPCMGVPTRNLDNINAEQTIAFDTRYCYKFNNTSNLFDELSPPQTWSGNDSEFFYATNYWQTSNNQQYFWVSNFSGTNGDPIRVYDGSSWFPLTPALDGVITNYLFQARLIIPYKGRLVALNTFEGSTLSNSVQYSNRARFSQNGAPLSSVVSGTIPTATQEWRSDIKGRGGFVDAPTNEHIISAQFIRDVLIVGFEHSTWALRYTGNELLPFVWDRINLELGCESTFSTVAFDRGILSVGDKSINACDGNNVERIDDAIPDEVFEIHNSFDPSSSLNDGALRVHGVRDFFDRLVYWTFPDGQTQAKFPDRLLVFNYHTKSWALLRENFTAFGTHQRFNDLTWADLAGQSWESANFSWISARLQSQFPAIVGGNHHGFVRNLTMSNTENLSTYYTVPSGRTSISNAPSLAITAVTGGASATRLNIANHNFVEDEFLMVNGILGTGATELNGRIYQVSVIDADNVDLYEKPRTTITAITVATQCAITCPGHTFQSGEKFYVDNITGGMTEIVGLNGTVLSVSGNTITTDIDTTTFTAYTTGGEIQNLNAANVPAISAAGTYLGCGLVTKLVRPNARSKKFNLIDKGKKNFLGHIDFLAEVTTHGEMSCEIYTDYSDSTPINTGGDSFFNTEFSTQKEQFDQEGQSKAWHRFFCTTDAQFFEFNLTLDDAQMFSPRVIDSTILFDAIVLYTEMGGRLVN